MSLRILTLVLILAPAASATAADPDGAAIYKANCEACHGAAGGGDGPAGAYLTPPAANFTTLDFWKSRDGASIRKVITEGGAAVGKSPLMTAWKGVLDAAQIEAVAKHVEGFKPKAP